MPWRNKDKSQKSPLRLVLWIACAALIFGVLGLGEVAEDGMRTLRNRLHPHQASGDIVFVKIDDSSLTRVGRWPWPRRYHASMINSLTNAGAEKILFDIGFDGRSDPLDDQALSRAIEGSKKVVLPIFRDAKSRSAQRNGGTPVQDVRKNAELSSLAVDYNYQNAVWRLSEAVEFQGKPIPTLSSALAARSGTLGKTFLIDYSLDTRSIPTINAADILEGTVPPSRIRGKYVLVGTDIKAEDIFFIPGLGQAGGAYVHIFGAETLRSGVPRNLGWLPALLISALGALASAFQHKARFQDAGLTLLTLALIAVPVPFEAHLLQVDVTPALFFTLTVWSILLWRRFSRGGLVHSVSGLPNLSALRSFRQGRDRVLVAARVLNYADVVANLPTEREKNLVEQIVSRFGVGSPDKMIFHGDGGIFAWFEEAKLPFGHHVDALHSMFRSPVKVGDLSADLTVSFGVEIGCGRSLASRLASALVAAEEAAHDGLRWKIYDPEKLRDAGWRLSILSQLDDAIDSGQVWVAYQPKLDLRTRQIIGAEALARWTHPVKGPIPAIEFIPAAEQHDRIGKLTDFVLENAIKVAARLNNPSLPFHIAVNLSARLLGDRDLSRRIARMLLEHVLEPQLLTLEVTETSAINSSEALATLAELKDLGIVISIDDYGTGLSTLEYLKKIPASEIKIDQSFVRGILENRSDRLMVQSTIALAHSLNRVVVAEGVETTEILDELAQLNCDMAQGFIIGRPMSSDSLRRRILVRQRRSAA